MKKLLMIAAGLMTATSVYAADEATDVKWDAELRTRYSSDSNKNYQGMGAGTKNGWVQRNKIGAKFSKGEKMSGYVGLIQNMWWGTSAATETTGTPNSSTAKNVPYVHQAYGWWKQTDNMSFKFGRFSMQIADGSLISASDWSGTPTAFEGVATILDYDFGRISIAGIKAADLTAGSNNTDPQVNMYGVSYDAKSLPDALKTANLTVLQVNQDQAATDGRTDLRAALVLAGEVSNIDFGLDYAMDNGKDIVASGGTAKTYTGTMLQAMVGYRMPETMNLHIGVKYHMDSGDDKSDTVNTDKTYSPFYYGNHNSGGLMDPFKWGNLTFIKADLSVDPNDATTVGLYYTMYSRTNAKSTVAFSEYYGGTSGTAGGSNTTDTALGNEVDLFVNYKMSKDFKLHAFYGSFTQGAAMTNSGAISAAAGNRFLVQTTMNF